MEARMCKEREGGSGHSEVIIVPPKWNEHLYSGALGYRQGNDFRLLI